MADICRKSTSKIKCFINLEVDNPVEEPDSHESRPDEIDDGINKRHRKLIAAQLSTTRVLCVQVTLKQVQSTEYHQGSVCTGYSETSTVNWVPPGFCVYRWLWNKYNQLSTTRVLCVQVTLEQVQSTEYHQGSVCTGDSETSTVNWVPLGFCVYRLLWNKYSQLSTTRFLCVLYRLLWNKYSQLSTTRVLCVQVTLEQVQSTEYHLGCVCTGDSETSTVNWVPPGFCVYRRLWNKYSQLSTTRVLCVQVTLKQVQSTEYHQGCVCTGYSGTSTVDWVPPGFCVYRLLWNKYSRLSATRVLCAQVTLKQVQSTECHQGSVCTGYSETSTVNWVPPGFYVYRLLWNKYSQLSTTRVLCVQVTLEQVQSTEYHQGSVCTGYSETSTVNWVPPGFCVYRLLWNKYSQLSTTRVLCVQVTLEQVQSTEYHQGSVCTGYSETSTTSVFAFFCDLSHPVP